MYRPGIELRISCLANVDGNQHLNYISIYIKVVHYVGIEPTTSRLKVVRSTN